jgi:hypothetical protein
MAHIFCCVPGDTFTGGFVDSWTQFVVALQYNGHSLTLSRAYSAHVNTARLRCLGGDSNAGETQAPFRGLDYDYILWIDSDISWTYHDFARLKQTSEETGAGVVTGLYLMATGDCFPAVEKWTPETLDTDERMPFIAPADIAGRDPFPVAYNGLGFALVRKGVYEALPYPWFEERRVEGRLITCSEDVSFCRDCSNAGIDVLVDPRVIVGHEKRVMLRPTNHSHIRVEK